MKTTATANNKKAPGQSKSPMKGKKEKKQEQKEELRKSKAEMLIDGELALDELSLYFDHFKTIWKDYVLLEELTINALKHQGVIFHKKEKRDTFASPNEVTNDFDTD